MLSIILRAVKVSRDKRLRGWKVMRTDLLTTYFKVIKS